MFSYLLIIKLLLLLINGCRSGIIQDSTSPDGQLAFRRNKCYETQTKQDEMFNLMTSPSQYKKWARPGLKPDINLPPPLFVNVSLDMNSLASMDDMNSEYSVILIMDLEWFDDRLVPTGCTNRDVLLSMEPGQYSRVWTPKLAVPDVKEPGSVEFSTQNVVAFKVRTDGYVFIRSRIQLKLFCQLNFKYYPFDYQKCSVKLDSRGLPDDNVILQWRKEGAFRNPERFQMLGFHLVGVELSNDTVQVVDLFEDDKVNRIIVTVHLEREWFHFLLDVFLPSGLFVCMSWLSFWLEISAAPARVTLGVTTMLTLVTNLMATREKLPKVSYIHALDIWITFCIVIVFASLIEFALVSYLYRSEKSRQKQLKKSHPNNLPVFSIDSQLVSQNDRMNSVSKYLDVMDFSKPKGNNLLVPNLANNLRRDSGTESTTSSSGTTSSTSTLSTCPLNKSSTTRKSQSFFIQFFKTKCPNELADNIDRKIKTYKQQRLPAWKPILTAGTVLPSFFFLGIAFIIIGVALLFLSSRVQQFELDYTHCWPLYGISSCGQWLEDNPESSMACKCWYKFELSQDFEGPVYMYYGLDNYYQSHRMYENSMDARQLSGQLEASANCAPFQYKEVEGRQVPIVPCGIIANTFFNDTFKLWRHDLVSGLAEEVPLLFTGISWPSDQNLFRNPTDDLPLEVVYSNFTNPPNWRHRHIWQLDPENPRNNGLRNEALMVWLRAAAFPEFRKLYARINHLLGSVYEKSLPNGHYFVEITYNYPVIMFDGSKSLIISNTSWIGGRNSFLGIAYILFGCLDLILTLVLTIIYKKYGLSKLELILITDKTPYFCEPRNRRQNFNANELSKTF